MPKFSVLYLQLNDENRDEVNSKGWNCPVGIAYLEAQMHKNYLPALELGLYEPAASLVAGSLEHAFNRLQNLDESWQDDRTIWCRTDFPRSMSVGDIILNHESLAIQSVASIGFDIVSGTDVCARLEKLFRL